jgi:hypothetical protein
LRLPYGPQVDFDDDAEHEINQELRSPSRERWHEMTSDRYVEQTHRVLARIKRAVEVNISGRNAGLAELRADWKAGRIGQRDYQAGLADHAVWKTRTVMFQTKVEDRLAQTRGLVERVTGEGAFRDLFAVVATLAAAVEEHRAAVTTAGQVRPADRVLWARLATLRVPTSLTGATVRTLQGLGER